ncbi:hypothetical protein C8J57DRAFT_1090027 [Mycena rebaudengoi]|nr:hypothetical protein C8J57DRAFT_1090027 [Mycena rebaudengoi]
MKHPNWPLLSFGALLGCNLASLSDSSGRVSPAGWLYCILMTESAHLIWKLRYESVIGNDGVAPTINKVHNRWLHMINERIKIDISLTSELKYGKEYSLASSPVLDTWKGTLKDEEGLPENWIRGPGVLAKEITQIPVASILHEGTEQIIGSSPTLLLSHLNRA